MIDAECRLITNRTPFAHASDFGDIAVLRSNI